MAWRLKYRAEGQLLEGSHIPLSVGLGGSSPGLGAGTSEESRRLGKAEP